MAVFDFFTSRNSSTITANTYIGHAGRLFYDDATGEIRISDGVTAGGLPIPITQATVSTVGGIKPGALVSVTGSGILNVNYSGSFSTGGTNTLTLNPASDTVLGGIKPGPGVVINAEGQLLIDSANLAFNFGDFSGTIGTYASDYYEPARQNQDYALLGSVNADEDIVLATNGDGAVRVVGDFSVRSPNGNIAGSLDKEPAFRVNADGQVRMLVPLADQVAGALEIVGNDTGELFPTNQTGVILHVTGNSGLVNRNYFDASENYALLVGRRLNGNVAIPSGAKEGNVLLRIAAQGLLGDNGNGYVSGESLDFGSFGTARIEFSAMEDQFNGAQGGNVSIWCAPIGSPGTAQTKILELNAQTGVTTQNITPQIDETYNLGSPTHRWGNVYIGRASLFLTDNATDESIEVTVNNGTMFLNGAQSLQVGNLTIIDNVLTTDSTTDIVMGTAGDTGNVLFLRDIKFADGTVQSTAWTDEHYASTLLGTTLADNVLNSSLTSVGTLANLTVTNPIVGSMSAALTAGTYLTSGGTYNGGTARTFAVDAATTATASKVVARDSSGNFAANTITANLTGTASTATNLTAATSILAGTLNVDPPAIGKNGSATATYTLTGLTTNHKVIVMPQAALPDEFNITASWASAANTLSIQYQTYGGGVDAAAFDIAYWAWV